MLTQDQIKNLKEGDKLTLTAFFECEQDGYVRFRLEPLPYLESLTICASRDLFSLPSDSDRTFCHVVDNMAKPKHNPTRLFREGDEVRVVEKDGRTPTCFPVGKIKVGDILTVIENEGGDAFINVKTEDGSKMMAPWFHLELVTPVEELEPFYLDEITDEDEDGEPYHCFMVKTLKGEDRVRTYYSNKFETIEQTKAAAEAECARLNEEWRKKQNQ